MFRPLLRNRARHESASIASLVQSAFGVFAGALTTDRVNSHDLTDQRIANDSAQR